MLHAKARSTQLSSQFTEKTKVQTQLGTAMVQPKNKKESWFGQTHLKGKGEME